MLQPNTQQYHTVEAEGMRQSMPGYVILIQNYVISCAAVIQMISKFLQM